MKPFSTLVGGFLLGAVFLQTSVALAQDTGLPKDKVALRYRIEVMDKDKWKSIGENKSFKKQQTIRFRFMSNVSGILYALNTSDRRGSLQPVFPLVAGEGLRQYLGPGTHIDANHVGIFPDEATGGGMRFTGVVGKERFLLIFIPDILDQGRNVMAIPLGAENWNFDAKTTYLVTGDPGHILFQFFELKSK